MHVDIPSHMLGHPAVYIPELFSTKVQNDLLALLVRKGKIPCNSADLNFYKTVHEDIGEIQPIGDDGACPHAMLVPNMNRTACILPGRIDVAKHYAMTGGFNGLKENLQSLFSRIQTFGVYIFDLEADENHVVKELFSAANFQQAAKSVCPKDKQYLDPFQFNFIAQIPGQTVPTHIDGVYFWGANRFVFPQWLLATMKMSGLFENEFIDQVQVVGYLSDWNRDEVAADPSKFGQFVYWDGIQTKYMTPYPRSGNAIDGSKLVHSTTLYQPHKKVPYLSKDKKNELVFDKLTSRWDLVSEGTKIDSFATTDLRISIVYRARCFRDEKQKDLHVALTESGESDLSLEAVLAKLSYNKPSENRLDLALWLLSKYVRYPYAENAIFPFNYCALFNAC